jgi:protein phosphatase
VSGALAVTRAIGDLTLKKEGVICVPNIYSFEINDKTQSLIIASDGLWDVCDD